MDTPAPQDPNAAAVPATKVPANMKALAAQWNTWKSHQRLDRPQRRGRLRRTPQQMNHFTWYETHNWTKPYPGETKIYAPNDVPGAYIPSSDNDG